MIRSLTALAILTMGAERLPPAANQGTSRPRPDRHGQAFFYP